MTDKLLF